jgi:hypothetical protein
MSKVFLKKRTTIMAHVRLYNELVKGAVTHLGKSKFLLVYFKSVYFRFNLVVFRIWKFSERRGPSSGRSRFEARIKSDLIVCFFFCFLPNLARHCYSSKKNAKSIENLAKICFFWLLELLSWVLLFFAGTGDESQTQ